MIHQPTLTERLKDMPRVAMMSMVQLSSRMGYSKQVMAMMFKRMYNPQSNARAFASYTPTEHDVLAAVFGKSGTNWTMQITQQIAHYGDAEFDHIHDVVAWPESSMPGAIPLNDMAARDKSPTGLRIIKTHLDTQYVPYNPKATYISVIRDPKEVCVSAFHFLSGVFGMTGYLSFEDWYELFFASNSFGMGWVKHTAGFWAWRDRPNVLVLTYNEMKRDPRGSIEKIAQTMGVSLTKAQFDKVVERSSFQYMKKHHSQFDPPQWALPNKHKPVVMIRRGQSGRSDELLTRQQQATIDQFAQAELQSLGSDFPYAELFEVVENPASVAV